MSPSANPYERQRFPPAIIQCAVWLYLRFNLSHRDIEDLLAERGSEVSNESVRLWCNKFDPLFSRRLKRRHPGFGDTFFIDEVFVTIAGQRHYLWRAVDQDGDVVDVYLQARRHAWLLIAQAGAAIPERPRGRLQPLQPATPAGVGSVLPAPSCPCI
jgi:transposase-like protein